MTGGFLGRRRADEFDALLSRARDGEGAAGDPAYDDLLEVVASLRSLPEVTARPAFVADLREQLVAEAAAQPARPVARRPVDDVLVARLTPTQRRGRNERRLAAVLGGFAVVAATGSMAMASQAALPGDALYPMKRAIENAQTNLQSDEAAKAETLLDQAKRRLAEVEALSERDGDVSAEIASTLEDFSEQTNQATSLALDEFEGEGNDGSLQDVRRFAGESMGQLTTLGERVPDGARPALINAAQTVRQVDSAAQQACPTCAGGSLVELPQIATRALKDLILPPTDDDLADVEAVERQARQVPQVEKRDRPKRVGPDNRDNGGQQPRSDVPKNGDSTNPDDGTKPSNPLKDIKDGLIGDGKDDGEQGLLGGVVDGVGGLLNGLLGG